MKVAKLSCHIGIGPRVSGEALVTSDDFSARYDLDRVAGVFSRPEHKLFGKCYIDKVLVFNNAKGGVATAWMLNEMISRKVAPKALLFNRVNPILAQGAALANMPLCDRFKEGDVTKLVRTGDYVTIDPEKGLIIIEKK